MSVSQSYQRQCKQWNFLLPACGVSVLNVGDRRRSGRGTGGRRPYHVNCILLGKYHVLINCRRSLHNSAQQLIFSSIHPFNLHLQRCRRVVTWGALDTLGSMWGLCDCVPVSYSYSIEKRREEEHQRETVIIIIIDIIMCVWQWSSSSFLVLFHQQATTTTISDLLLHLLLQQRTYNLRHCLHISSTSTMDTIYNVVASCGGVDH